MASVFREAKQAYVHPVRYAASQFGVRNAIEWCYDEMGADAVTPSNDHYWDYNSNARWTYLAHSSELATFLFREENDALIFKLRWHGVAE